jgi:hypothetical protein
LNCEKVLSHNGSTIALQLLSALRSMAIPLNGSGGSSFGTPHRYILRAARDLY